MMRIEESRAGGWCHGGRGRGQGEVKQDKPSWRSLEEPAERK